jgi:hypothetical protein
MDGDELQHAGAVPGAVAVAFPGQRLDAAAAADQDELVQRLVALEQPAALRVVGDGEVPDAGLPGRACPA